MNLLFYCEPSFCHASAGCARPDLSLASFFGDHIASTLLESGGVSIKTILPSTVSFLNDRYHALDCLNPIPISFCELFDVFRADKSLSGIYRRIYDSSFSEVESSAFSDLILEKLGGWKPDLIITYPIHNDILRRLYPSALCLQMENGVFSRHPLPLSIKLDPFHYANEFVRRFRDEIENVVLSDRDRQAVEGLMAELRTTFRPAQNVQERFASLRRRFRHLVLLPILTSNCYGESDCDDQLAFLHSVMGKVPPSVGVIITFHDTVSSQINSGIMDYLRELYPNLFYFSPDMGIGLSGSVWLFSSVDAVINCCTMTGLQAMVFGTRLVAMDKSYSHGFADHVGLDGLEEFLDSPPPDKSRQIFWYLTHGNVFDRRFGERDWSAKYYNELVARYRRDGVTFDLFPQIEDISDLASYIIKKARANIRRNNARKYVPDFALLAAYKIKCRLLRRR